MYAYALLALITAFNFLITKTETQSIYNTIQESNIASLEWVDEEWPNESFHDYLVRCLHYQAKPQSIKKRRQAFKLLDACTQSQKSEKNHNALADLITAQDLHLLCGPKPLNPYFGSLMTRTKTEMGRVFFYGLISSPMHEIAALEKRQETIKALVNDPALFENLQSGYSELAACENLLMSFWAQDGFVQITKRHYFSLPYFSGINDKLNTSETFLGMRSLVSHATRFTNLVTILFASTLLPAYAYKKMCDTTLPGPLQKMAEHVQGSGGQALGLLSSVENKHIACAATLLAGLYCALGSKEDYEWAQDNVKLDVCLQTKMKAIAQFFATAKKLKNTLDLAPTFVKKTAAAEKIVDFFTVTVKNNPDLSELIALLETPTFQEEPSALKHQGRVLLAFRLMYNTKETLEPLILALAELDAYLSVATLYNEHKDKRVHFCFPTYKKDIQPSLHIQQFWNPFIDANKVVANDVTLQSPDRRNMVITGPNAGGKSTLIKSIVSTIISAQSLCIAAADDMEFTPFYNIGTYLNVVDDIAAGNSLFKAQVMRAQQIVELVEKTPTECFSFVALDEMFNGTSAKESKAAAYAVGKHIGQYANNICVLATHFPLLTNLAKELNSFENYKVSVIIDESKGIHYPFILEKGISNQHIALNILQKEGFACSIVDDALGLLGKSNKKSISR